MKSPTNSSAESKGQPVAQTLQQAKQQHSENLRQSVVQAAAALLLEHGPSAVTVRRVAERMECSTKIIYSLFSKKEGLAKQLYLEGCRLLGHTFESVPLTGSPSDDLGLLAQAYWQFSREYTSFYQVMFGGSFAEFKPDEDNLHGMANALSQVAALLRDNDGTQQESPSDDGNLETLRLIWAPLHGVIHLYLTGQICQLEEAERLYKRTVSMIVGTVFGEGKKS